MHSVKPKDRWVAALTVVLSAFMSRDGVAQSAKDSKLSQQIRELIDPLAAKKLFSGVVLIERSDGTRAVETFGMADVEWGRPITPETRTCIASITKAMTQLIFAQLIAEGKVKGDDPVAKYLPGFPKGPSGGSATVQMLLDHRVGVPHRVTKPNEEAERWVPERIVSRVVETGLRFDPGAQRLYSSAGYTCLARIAEVVEGKSFGRVMQERVFNKAGMTNAIDPGPREVVARAARDYLPTLDDRGEPALERAQPRDYSFLTGAGSVWATADDLVQFVRALRSGKFGEGQLERMLALQSETWRGWDGGTGGFASSLEIHRTSGAVIALWSNVRSGAFQELKPSLRELVDTGTVRPVSLPPPPVDDDRLTSELGGYYVLGEDNFTVERRGRGILIQDSYAYPIGEGKLYSPYWYAELRPVRDADGHVTGLEAATSSRKMRFERK